MNDIFRNGLRSVGAGVLVTAALMVQSACSVQSPSERATVAVSEKSPAVIGEVITSPNDQRGYRAVSLANGIEVLLVSDPAAEKSAAALSVGVGSFFNPEDFQGLAHYLEHMLFLGTEKYPEPDQFMEFAAKNGGVTNAYTSLSITNYMFEVKNSEYEEGLDRFAQFFTAPLLYQEYSDKEKNAVNAEWLMRRDSDGIAIWALGRQLLGDHPANTFAVGNLDSLSDKASGALYDAMRRFYDRYYSANIMKLVLVSNRPLQEMESLAQRYFDSIPDKQIEKPAVTKAIEPEEVGGKRIHFVPQEDQRLLQIEFIIENNADQFRVKPNQYLAYIIGSEMPNTPAARLKELGWASALTVASQPDYFGNYGIFDITVDLTDEGMRHRPEITDLIMGYIELLRAEGVDGRFAPELSTSLTNRFRFLEKTGDFAYASRLAAAMQEYPLTHAIDAPFRFEGFDQQAVDAVLGQLVPERMRVWYISQDETVDQDMPYYSGRYSVEPLTLSDRAEQLAAVESYGLAIPALNSLLPESFAIEHEGPAPEHVVSTNGIDIWLQGSELYREQPKGWTQIYLNSPARQNSAEAEVLLALWSDLFGLKQAKLFDEAGIAGMNAGVSASNGLSLTISGFTDKQPILIETALQNLKVVVTEAELTQAIDRYVRGLNNSKQAYPFRQLFPNLRRLVRTGNHSEDALTNAAEAIDLEAFNRFVQAELSNSLIRVYMFGNYSINSAQALGELIEGALGPRLTEDYVQSSVYAPAAGSAVVYQQDLPVDDLGMLYLFVSPDTNIESRASAEILGNHLSNRAFNQLRTEEQLGYAAGGVDMLIGDHSALGLYIQTPVKNPVQMLDRFNAFLADYQQMLAELPAEEFERLKAGLLSNLTKPPKNLSEEAGPYVADWNEGRYDFDTKARLIAAVERTTIDDVRRYYQKTVAASDAARILIQLRGRAFADEPFAIIDGARVVTDIDAFHAEMPVQQR